MKLSLVLGALLSALAFLAGAADARTGGSICSKLSASTGAGGNGMTGGMLEWTVTVTNRSRRACMVEGRPFVRVAASSFPVTVADLQPGEFGISGRSTPIRLTPGQSAHALIVVVRNCGDFSKRVARTLHADVGFGGASVSVRGEACAQGGATVLTGGFQR